MNRKYVPVIAFSLAVLLVGSVAYAADRKKKARSNVREPGELSEESLKAELLGTAAAPSRKKPAPRTAVSSLAAGSEPAEAKVK